ncbi:unnamed protein product, partial [Fusarium langsethiae]
LPRVTPMAEESLPVPPAFERSGTTTSETQYPVNFTISEGTSQSSSQSLSRTTVVRGFSPSKFSTSRTIFIAQLSDNILEPKSPPVEKAVQSKRPPRFALGGSCSPTERDQSLRNSEAIIKKPIVQIGGSPEEKKSLNSAVPSWRRSSLLSERKERPSFSINAATQNTDDHVAMNSDSDGYIAESAIDDEDP